MNYFLLINAFYESLEQKPLKPPQIALWHALANIANKAGWPATFTVSITALSNKTGMNRIAVERARNTLAQMGYIQWKTRGGSAAAIYDISNLCIKNAYRNDAQTDSPSENDAQVDVQSDAQSDAQLDVQSEAQIFPLYNVPVQEQELELELEPNDRQIVSLSDFEEGQLHRLLYDLQLETLEPYHWQEDMAEYIRAMFTAPAIWVRKQRVPQAEVRERMKQLDHDTVQWAIDQIKNADEIDNPRSYMMAVLYNAPVDFSAFTSIDVARRFGNHI